jgi:hypothetical protein
VAVISGVKRLPMKYRKCAERSSICAAKLRCLDPLPPPGWSANQRFVQKYRMFTRRARLVAVSGGKDRSCGISSGSSIYGRQVTWPGD